jgi:hypothetical protein
VELTKALTERIVRELSERKGYLDASTNIGEVQIIVKLTAGTTHVKGVVWVEQKPERDTRARHDYNRQAGERA